MSKNILYTPQLGYKKNYYTEGTFDTKQDNNSNVVENNVPIINAVEILQNDIDNNLKLIPEQIKNTYISPYIVLKEEIDKLEKEETEKKDTNKVIESNKDDDDDFPSDFFDKDSDIYIDIEDPYAEKSKIIKEQYYTDFLDVYKDYLSKLNESIQNYIYTSISAFKTSFDYNDGVANLNDYSTRNLNNSNLYHLSDYLIKSSISLDQTLRLHEKLFDLDSAILHVRGIKIAEKIIERYYSIEKLPEDNDIAMSSNILLEESKRVADKKYKENFLSLYKYLNSSVILMSESLQTLLKENKSAMAINMYEAREQQNDTNTTN